VMIVASGGIGEIGSLAAFDALADERDARRCDRLAERARRELVRLADDALALDVEPAADDEQRRPRARGPLDRALEPGLRRGRRRPRDPRQLREPARERTRALLERGPLGAHRVGLAGELVERLDGAVELPRSRRLGVPGTDERPARGRDTLLVAGLLRPRELQLGVATSSPPRPRLALGLAQRLLGGGLLGGKTREECLDRTRAIAHHLGGASKVVDLLDRGGQPLVARLELAREPHQTLVAHRREYARAGARQVRFGRIRSYATRELLERTAAHAADFLDGLAERPVAPAAGVEDLRAALGGPLPDGPSDPALVLDELVAAADPGVVAIPGGRYFGFVTGGAVPAALAADWLTSVWDQNAVLFAGGPAAAVVEEVAGAWLKELLGLPTHASFALVTGCQMAHVTALAAARHHVLHDVGWDVERDGLAGAPPVRVLAGAERHVTVDRALRLLGLGDPTLVDADGQGRMRPDALRTALAEATGPTIVCTQVGNVNTGSIDELPPIVAAARDAGAWVHVDGAFGLWAAASPSLRGLVDGVDRADSWATDGHKWLNVPYDCGIALVAHPDSHRAALGVRAGYLVHAAEDAGRDAMDWTPESSRRARGFTVYAALRSLGRAGVAELVDGCCAHARRFAERLGREPGVEVLNDVVLNQVLVRFLDPGGDHDARTAAVVHRVQDDGVLWLGGTTWRGMGAMRISVSNWSTTAEDVDRSVDAILAAAAATVPASA
jgi:glutamate/tyrosine decarboxylase-like PLP-dependent enzyme